MNDLRNIESDLATLRDEYLKNILLYRGVSTRGPGGSAAPPPAIIF